MNAVGFKMSGRSYLSPPPRFMIHWYPLEGEISIRVNNRTERERDSYKDFFFFFQF